MTRPRKAETAGVLIYVQHLLGIGHVTRAVMIAAELARLGIDTTLVSGGAPVLGIDVGGARLVQLPPLRARDASFSALLDESGAPIDAAYLDRRRALLLELDRELRPAVLVTEHFPFGRRALQPELIPLIETARAKGTRIVASVRDILVPARKAGRAEETADIVNTLYDLVMVHGDPRIVGFDETFAAAPMIAARLRYTGYIAPLRTVRREPDAAAGDVVVSAGGGAVGERIYEAALAARARSRLHARNWRLLVGHNLAEDRFQSLRQRAAPGVIVERARSDFRALLAQAAVSVSQAGYNTVMDVLTAGVAAVVVPFADERESEQMLRAERLRGRGLVEVVTDAELSADRLAAAIDDALARSRQAAPDIDLGGLQTSARLLAQYAARRGPVA